MEQSKKVYFDNTLYIDSKIKDKNYIHNNNLVVGTDNSIPPNIYKSILKFNSNNWNFAHIDSIYLFIFLEKIDFKYSYNGNISILCYPEDISNCESLEDFSKLNFSKRLNLTFPPKAIERYIKIDITNIFTSIYSSEKVYNLILEPYFSADNENSTSIIEFLSNNSKMPPYLIINGSLIERPLDENHKQDITDFKLSCSNFLDEIKSLNKNSLDKISSQIECIENFNNNLLNDNKNINKILNSEILSKNEFYEFMKKFDSNNVLITTLNENIINNNSLISSLKNITEKNNVTINKISEQLNNNNISINNLITNIKNTDSTISSLATTINSTSNFIEILIKEINNIKLSINALNTKLINNDSIIACLDNCSNSTLDISKEIKNLNNCILSLNTNVKNDKSILKNLNSSIDEILKFTENITLTTLE